MAGGASNMQASCMQQKPLRSAGCADQDEGSLESEPQKLHSVASVVTVTCILLPPSSRCHCACSSWQQAHGCAEHVRCTQDSEQSTRTGYPAHTGADKEEGAGHDD